jgi:hypothetical protein
MAQATDETIEFIVAVESNWTDRRWPVLLRI